MAESTQVKYLLVGGGVASAQAAVGIRQIDSEGSVLLVSRESWWPYDRPPLSKSLLLGETAPEDAESKDPSWYAENRVEVRRSTVVKSIDLASRTASLENGDSVGFERLLLATGATPKRLNIPGANLPGVHLLRKMDESLAIRDAIASAKTAVMIGAGYVGLEVGAACIKNGVQVTLVDPTDHPWSKFASPLSGNYVRRAFETKGATFRFNDEVIAIEGTERATGVRLKSGEVLTADLVVMGVGVQLNVELAKAAGLEIDEKHGVVVDEFLKVAGHDVWIAGDIAAFQDLAIGKRWHAEHYLNGKWQGIQAGRNMAGAGEAYNRVPYFFSDMLEIHMVLRGDAQGGRSIGEVGDLVLGEFVELYAREDGSLAMGIGISHSEARLDSIADKLEELIRAKTHASSIGEAEFGFDSDGGLG